MRRFINILKRRKPPAPVLDADTLSSVLYAIPERGPRRENFPKRIVFGVGCSLLGTAILNVFALKKAVVWTCAGLLFISGWRTQPPDGSEEAKQGGFWSRQAERAKGLAHQGVVLAEKAKEKAAEPAKKLHAKVDGQVEVIKKDVKEGQQEMIDALAGRQPGQAAQLPPQMPPQMTPQQMALANQQAGFPPPSNLTVGMSYMDAHKRDALEARARAVGLKSDPSWGTAVFEMEVNRAEQAAWEARWNARCPACKGAMFIPGHKKTVSITCLNCKKSGPAKMALRMGPPRRPNNGKPLLLGK